VVLKNQREMEKKRFYFNEKRGGFYCLFWNRYKKESEISKNQLNGKVFGMNRKPKSFFQMMKVDSGAV